MIAVAQLKMSKGSYMQESQQQASKPRTGEKVDNRFQSPEQAAKLRTGEKVDNRRESPRQAAKSRTGEKVYIILGWKKPRPGVEPRTGVYVQPAHRTPFRDPLLGSVF